MHNKVFLSFNDPDQRDFVFAQGARLSTYIQDGEPTAGMRMDVPTGLVDTHKLLNDLGYQIKRQLKILTIRLMITS